MKILNLMQVVLILLCSLSAITLQAQGNYVATPANANQIATQIFSDYEVGITIPQLDVINYVNQVVLNNPYCPGCQEPTLIVDEISPLGIDVSWNPVPGAINYELIRLNLNDGSKQTYNTAANEMNMLNLPNAMYAISIVAQFSPGQSGGASRANIIILDKPIMLILDPVNDCPCDNPTLITTAYQEEGSGAIFKFAWTPNTPAQYLLNINYGNDLGSSFRYETQYGEGDIPILLNLQCMANIRREWEFVNLLRGPGNTNDFSVRIDPEDYHWAINDQSFQINYVSLYACGHYIGNEENRLASPLSEEKVNFYPNPAMNTVTLKIEMRPEETARVEIINVLGQTVYTNENLTDKTIINTSNWAAGNYKANFYLKNKLISNNLLIVK